MSTKTKKAKRKDEDDLAVELAKAVLEETTPAPEAGAAADSEGVAPEQQEAQEGGAAPQPSEELLQSIRDRKDRRDSENNEAPTNLDEANEVIRQQNEDIDALLSMLDKKNEEEKPAEEGAQADSDDVENTGSEVEENTDGEEEENVDCGDDVNKDEEGEEEKAPTMNADSIDAMVRARASLMNLGERFNIDGLDRLPIADAMKKVIKFATPGIRLDSATEIKGAFKVAVAVLNSQKDTDYQRKQMHNGVRTDGAESSKADEARQRMINRRK